MYGSTIAIDANMNTPDINDVLCGTSIQLRCIMKNGKYAFVEIALKQHI